MTLDTTLIAACRLVLGEEYDVVWEARDTGWRDRGGCVYLSSLGRSTIGVDEPRATAVGATDVQERIYGVRTLRVQVMCEADDQDPEDSAEEIAEALAAGFHRTDVETLLDDENLGGVRVQPRRRIDGPSQHGDTRSIWAFEVWFNTSRTQAGPLVPVVGAVEHTGTDSETDAVIVGPVTVEV